MKTLIDIRKTAGVLWERHSFISTMMDVAGVTSHWNSTTKSPNHLLKIENDSRLNFGKNGAIVALIAPLTSGYCQEFAKGVEAENSFAVQQLFDQLAERIDSAGANIDSVIEEDINTFVDITYDGRSVMTNIVLDTQLNFNLVAIDFRGTDIDPAKLQITYRNREVDMPEYGAVVTVSSPELTELEKIAMIGAPSIETEVKLNFSPRAKFLDDVVDDVGDAAKKGIDAVAVGAGAAYGAAKVAGKDVGKGVADVAEDAGVDDAAAEAIGEGVADATVAAAAAGGPMLQGDERSIDYSILTTMDSEASVDQLLVLRNKLLIENEKRK